MKVAGPLAALVFFLSLGSAALAQTTPPCPFTWTATLRVGSTGASVRALQQLLNSDPTTTIATSGAGSQGNETSSFGKLTAASVSRFQEKYASDILTPNGLIKGTGVVGAATRAKLNGLCTAPAASAAGAIVSVSTTTSDTGTDQLTISDPGQPPGSIAPAGAGVNFTTVTLTAGSKDVVLKSMTIERVGMGADASFGTIALTDPNFLQIGNQFALHADHKVTITGPYTIPAHTSATLTVVAYMAADLSDHVGEMPTLQIDAVNASSPIVGSLPIRGNPQAINNSLVIGSVSATLSPEDPGGAITRYIGDKNVRFSGIRMLAASQEDVGLGYMIWEQNGTASARDIANVVTIVNDIAYPAIVQPDGKTYITIFNPALVIPKGTNADVSVRGDLTTLGAGHTAEFDIHDNTDDEGTFGETYQFGVGVFPSDNTAVAGNHSAFITSDGSTDGDTGTPFFSGSIVTISGGAATAIQNAQ